MSLCSRFVLKKIALLPPLLLALFLLKDDNGNCAVWNALQKHPPSMRVYRAMTEVSLLLFCTSFALRIWSTTNKIGGTLVGRLLFEPPSMLHDERTPAFTENFQRISASDDDTDDEENNDDEQTVDNHLEEYCADNEDDNFADEDQQAPVSRPQAPSSISVASAALDLLLSIFISLFFFTLSSAGGGRLRKAGSEIPLTFLEGIAAPTFPLILFVGFAVKCVLPWSKRGPFWLIISDTIGAPFTEVTFRDGFMGDILTSTVRPLQDLAFTMFYIASGLQGWFMQSYSLDAAATPVEHSWLLHTIVLPACMVSPLWWRFLQNLRQSYNYNQRWPYLGNAFKYMVAAEVAMFGVFDPAKKQHILWLSSFICATLYQIWWDVFMDWELFALVPHKRKLALRSTRYYSVWVYWVIFVVNFSLRFCWTLSFLPVQYLNETGILKHTFEAGDYTAFISPVIASAEIIRRTLWGLLRLESEAIKVQGLSTCTSMESSELEMKPMAMPADDSANFPASASSIAPSAMSSVTMIPMQVGNKMSDGIHSELLGELCLWATAFVSLGIFATAHRQSS